MIKLKNYIGGEWMDPADGEYLDNVEPATGEVYSQIPRSGQKDIDLAVEAAKKAFPEWSSTDISERAAIMARIADLIEARLEKLARAESKDNGKPLKLATHVDIPRASSNFRFFSRAITQWSGSAYFMRGHERLQSYTMHQPLGVVGCISPWNLPLYLFTWKIAPALATGNTVVAKPSEVTPYTAYLLGEICNEAGLPAGVLNIVHGLGPEAGQAIVEHQDIKAISFTGGTKTGSAIAALAAPRFKKLSLELGGKNPNVIFADCNYDKMLKTTLLSSFANQGQICLCGSRILIERTIYNQFKADFVSRVKEMKVGDPLETDSKLGSVVSKGHQQKILEYIELAKEEGGKILTGGHAIYPEGRCAKGYFVAPTVIEGLDNQCRTNQEEIFGPVVTLQPFDTEEEALALANGTPYGLASTIWTQDISRANRMASDIHAGIVWINCWLQRDLRTPFGGVKQSGVGREGGFDALEFFTEAKSVTVAY